MYFHQNAQLATTEWVASRDACAGTLVSVITSLESVTAQPVGWETVVKQVRPDALMSHNSKL
jgi:hypothetical protein